MKELAIWKHDVNFREWLLLLIVEMMLSVKASAISPALLDAVCLVWKMEDVWI